MNKFLVVIPTYNAEAWIARCIESVLSQNYRYFEVVVIDDLSTDKTWDIICKYPVHTIYNSSHIGSAVANLKRAIEAYSFNPDDIIVNVDGDDYLHDNGVLSYLNYVYHPDIWLTYGQNISLSGNLDRISHPLTNIKTWYRGPIEYISLHTNEYRNYGLWHTSHLRTFRAGLFKKIKDEDLRYEDGQYFRTCCDVCTMYPMIEMAGDKHIFYVDKILYVYNDLNGYGNRAEENMRNMEYLQSKPNYEEITDYRG